ncbi:MAG: YcbK family protein [Stellaceae bacterium]
MNRRRFFSLAAGAAALPMPALAVPTPQFWRLDLINAHTGEKFSGPFRDARGPIQGALTELSYFLRDFHSGATIGYHVSVLDFLTRVMDAVAAPRATILSAYRTPETNAMLARTTFGVAEHSQHMYGRALDVYLPARLEDAVLSARAMQRGGVGWYPRSGFIHLHTGPVRNWTLSSRGYGIELLGGHNTPWFHEPLAIPPDGELIARRTGRPVTVADRLSLHRLLDRAVGLSATR